MLHYHRIVLIVCLHCTFTGISGRHSLYTCVSPTPQELLPLPEIDRISEDFVKQRSVRFKRGLIHRHQQSIMDGMNDFHLEKSQHKKAQFNGLLPGVHHGNRKTPRDKDHTEENVNLLDDTGSIIFSENTRPIKAASNLFLKLQKLRHNGITRSKPKSRPPELDMETLGGGLQEVRIAPKAYESVGEVLQNKRDFLHQPYDLALENHFFDSVMHSAVKDRIKGSSLADVADATKTGKKEKKDVTFFGQRTSDVSTEVSLSEDEESDFSVGIISECDFMDIQSKTCWFEREVGDSLTFALNITTYRKEETFIVRWYRTYTLKNNRRGIRIEMLRDRAPWNAVVGSGGTELRLSPITDTDMDPNSFVAKVYGMNQESAKTMPKLIQEIIFRVDTIPIDMGSVYSGEEVNINVENYISLPEEGVTVVWGMEKSLTTTEALPSNMKTSVTGRSMVIKELKRDQQGVISCIMYSSASIAIAKRRFKIQKPVEPWLKRSPNSMESQSLDTALYGQHNERKNLKSSDSFISSYTERKYLHKRSKRVKRKVSIVDYVRSLPRETRQVYEAKMNQLARLHPRNWRNSRAIELSLKLVTTDQTLKDTSGLQEQVFAGGKSKRLLQPGLKDFERDAQEQDLEFDDLVSKEVHYVTVKSVLVTHGAQERSMTFEEQESYFVSPCDSDSQCGSEATCIVPAEGHGYCSCHEKKKGNGVFCYVSEDDLTMANQRQKRIRSDGIMIRASPKFENLKSGLFYDGGTPDPRDQTLHEENLMGPQSISELKVPGAFPMIYEERSTDSETNNPALNGLFFDDEESYLLSPCEEDKQCSYHAWCVKPVNGGHGYCKCRSGFRGNGMFCWEDVNYVPPHEFVFEKEQGSQRLPEGNPSVIR